MRSRILSKFIPASCVGYFNRAHYGFYVTASRMLVVYIMVSAVRSPFFMYVLYIPGVLFYKISQKDTQYILT